MARGRARNRHEDRRTRRHRSRAGAAARRRVRDRRSRDRQRPRRGACQDEAGRRLRRRGAVGAPRGRAHRAAPRLSCPDREAARRDGGGCARHRRRRARCRPRPRGDPEPPLSWPSRGASGASSNRASSGRRRASTATSSSRRTSAASARRCAMCCCSTWRSTPSTRRASSSAATPSGVYCREWDPAGSWYLQGSSAVAIFDMQEGPVFTYRGSWCADGLGTSWESAWRIVGERGSADLGRPCRHPRRGPHRRARGALRPDGAGRGAAARSARPRRRSSRA